MTARVSILSAAFVSSLVFGCGGSAPPPPMWPEGEPAPEAQGAPPAEPVPEPAPEPESEAAPEQAPAPEAEPAPEQAPAPEAEPVTTGVEGANFTIGELSANGVAVSDLACRTEGGVSLGGFFGAVALIAAFSERKEKLDGCVQGEAVPFRVRWDGEGGAMKNVEVISAPHKANKCVVKALKGAAVAIDGTCALTIQLGK